MRLASMKTMQLSYMLACSHGNVVVLFVLHNREPMQPWPRSQSVTSSSKSNHGRSCIGARSCPLPSRSSILHHHQYLHRPLPQRSEPDASHRQNNHLPTTTPTFLPTPARSSFLYGVSIHLLRNSKIYPKNFHFAMLMSSLPSNIRITNQRIALWERKKILRKNMFEEKRSLYTKQTWSLYLQREFRVVMSLQRSTVVWTRWFSWIQREYMAIGHANFYGDPFLRQKNNDSSGYRRFYITIFEIHDVPRDRKCLYGNHSFFVGRLNKVDVGACRSNLFDDACLSWKYHNINNINNRRQHL